jgi:hypothetical protein
MEKTKLVGLMINDLGINQLNFYLINHINNLIKSTNDYDFMVFIKDLIPPSMRPECAVLNSNEIWSFDGIVISTNLDSALSSLNAVNVAKNVLYVWDLEWLRAGKNNYINNISILRNPNLEIVARSQEHATAIENYANIEIQHIIPDINLKDILYAITNR